MAETWGPALDDVARRIPTRTRDVRTPGSDELLGTFSTNTTPDADEAQAVIDAAVLAILSETGPLDPRNRELLDQAREAAAWRAAADIELAYPNRDADVHIADQLDARAKYELSVLVKRLQGLGEGPLETVPAWSAPDPPAWADRDPDARRIRSSWWPWP